MEEISEGGVDRISSMPDCILDKILGYCKNAKQVAQTSVLSKRWCDVYTSYPHFQHLGNICRIVSKAIKRGEHGVLSEAASLDLFPKELEKFNKFINFKLNGLLDKKLSLGRFWVSLDLGYDWLNSWLGTWLEMAVKCKVQDLKLHVHSKKENDFYILPEFFHGAETITKLELDQSHFKCTSIGFHSLRELQLYLAKIDDDTIHVLNSSCRMIESLCFNDCVGFSELNINGLHMLKDFFYTSNEVCKVFIEAPHLESLFYSYSGELSFETYPVLYSRSNDLREVSLSGVCISKKYLRNLLWSSHLMDLTLSSCVMLDKIIMISSISLRTVAFKEFKNLVEAIFDTPNLGSFRYDGSSMPQLLSVNGFVGWNATLVCNLYLDATWCENFAKFIGVPNKFQELTVKIYMACKLRFWPDNLSISSPPNVLQIENLKLICSYYKPLDFEDLLDSLFCYVRPKTLHIEAPREWRNELQELNNLLLDNNRSCCNSSHDKCWRHFLKEVTVKKEGETMFELALLFELNWSTTCT